MQDVPRGHAYTLAFGRERGCLPGRHIRDGLYDEPLLPPIFTVCIRLS